MRACIRFSNIEREEAGRRAGMGHWCGCRGNGSSRQKTRQPRHFVRAAMALQVVLSMLSRRRVGPSPGCYGAHPRARLAGVHEERLEASPARAPGGMSYALQAPGRLASHPSSPLPGLPASSCLLTEMPPCNLTLQSLQCRTCNSGWPLPRARRWRARARGLLPRARGGRGTQLRQGQRVARRRR